MSQSSALVERGQARAVKPQGRPQQPQRPVGRTQRFNEGFRRCASAAANAVGSKWAFLLSCVVVLAWAAMGPIFHYSDTWQLVINTGTTIVTFLMVFLIQNTQNRDAKAIHLKLDELIRSAKGARNHLVNLEEFTDEELADLQKQFERVREHAAQKAEHAHRRAEEAHDKAEDAHDKADAAHEKAGLAHGVSERAEDTAEDAHQTARAARDAAEEARERARRAEERAVNVNR